MLFVACLEMKLCCHCREHFQDNANFCPNCGKKLINSKCLINVIIFENTGSEICRYEYRAQIFDVIQVNDNVLIPIFI